MFKIYDKFNAYNKNMQPYSFSIEKHTETANLHAGVTKDGFSLKSVGNRFILNTPDFYNCTFKMDFTISYPFEINPCFYILFGYDNIHRIGNALQIKYTIGKKLSVTLVSVKNCEYVPQSDSVESEWILPKDKPSNLTFTINGGNISLSIDNIDFSFKIPAKCGKLALDRDAFIGELIIKNLSFVSEDNFEIREIIKTPKINIPITDGGDIPYTVCYAINKICGEYYMTVCFDGGTKSRPVNKNERPGQYVAEIDWMTSPYAGLYNENNNIIFELSNGENCFVDPNIFWDCQKIFFGDKHLPVINHYKLENFVPNSQTCFIFGYENLLCKGYELQSGGREFRFRADGTLINDTALQSSSNTYELISPPDKKALSFVPDDCYDREQVIEHLSSNHYFSVDEDIDFNLVLNTEIQPEYLSFKAEIANVFETKILDSSKPCISVENVSDKCSKISIKSHFSSRRVGVYKIIYTIMYGGSEYKKISHAFEVYDAYSELCPPLESDLPFMFSMNNEQKKLERNAFDVRNPKPSCDFGHYIACAANTPVEAEKRKIWNFTKLFGRKWFVWIAIRTCTDYLSHTHDISVKNADYVFHTGINTDCDPLGAYGLFPLRIDHWQSCSYNYPGTRILIDEFFSLHPEYKTSYKIGSDTVTCENYNEFVSVCGQELIDFINKKNCEYIKNHNRRLEQLNPNVKRAIYGPLPPYNNPTLTYHSLKYFGMPDNEDLCKEYFNGFAIFEDYPFSCSYQTYRGPFAAMTLLLHFPELTLYPELYSGSRGGCIDGAVKYAHAPMGDYYCPPYQNSTLAFEYVYNTAYKTKSGFGYWHTYGFHRGMDTDEYVNEFVHNWHHVHEHKPKKPMRSVAYIIDYSGDDDFYCPECNYCNQSESSQTVVYECARESGIPNGFGITFDVLETLTEKDCDVLVLPSLAKANAKDISEIRRLYNSGVNLIAVSDITGLEDIFGVKKSPFKEEVFSVEYNEKQEYVRNTAGTFTYIPTSAHTVLTVNGNTPAMISTDRTALINTAVIHLGINEQTKMTTSKGCFIIGKLIRAALTDTIKKLSSPLVFGENVGVTLFEDTNGNKMLLAIDYTPFDNIEHTQKEAVISLNMPDVYDISSNIEVKAAKTGNVVRELRFNILPHGYVFINLITK